MAFAMHRLSRDTPRLAIAFFGLGLVGCIFPIDNEDQTYVPPVYEPAVIIYSYQVERADNGATLAEGCVAFNSNRPDLVPEFQARIPLGVPYNVVIEPRAAEGSISTSTSSEWFCGPSVSSQHLGFHVSPSCYASRNPEDHQLIDAALYDAAGNRYPTPDGTDAILGADGNTERFSLVSRNSGVVILYLFPSCPPLLDGSEEPISSRYLLTVLP